VPVEALLILWVIKWIGAVVGVYAFIHALMQRPDAYTAIERMTKPAWLGITAGGTVALLLFGLSGIGWMFWIAGLVAALVYIVDVRPRLIEVQRGNRW
jgi:energy-converting hydrogenase Eha subunit G